MAYDGAMLKAFYAAYQQKVNVARNIVARPLCLAEKILYSHLYNDLLSVKESLPAKGEYTDFRPDRVAMQDATAQMAVLQFMNAGRASVAVPSTVHCDHLICARDGADKDLPVAMSENAEVYDFLRKAAGKYGMGFWKPGAGIIHQVVLENYAFPGGMMVGTDSHTPNAGGLGMIAIGVGGADAVDVMAGMEWELKFPQIIGVKLTGKLKGWASPKDVILKLAGILTVKGGTNHIIEYYGEGTESLSCTGKATICNMGAEVGATTSVFPYDAKMAQFLAATGREDIADMADSVSADLKADEGAEQYYDRIIEIDLDSLEPYINGPFTPDAARELKDMKDVASKADYPDNMEVSLIGSCTNSSYQDLARAASVVDAALKAGLTPKAGLIINPGSERIRATAQRDGILDTFRKAGAIIMTNACGPCIGQWKRKTEDPMARNSIITSFNRNFAKRADGNPNTHAFITSPEIAAAMCFAGRLGFNPSVDVLDCPEGAGFKFPLPQGAELPTGGFAAYESGCILPEDASGGDTAAEGLVKPGSNRLQILKPFAAWDGKALEGLSLLIKTKGKCTTDHISMAGPWLKFRGHLENISENLLMGAVNAFNGETNKVLNSLTDEYVTVSQSARIYRDDAKGSIVVAEDNYGEGSSREHAAMEPRFLGVKAVLAKSFARIHETNLKKQGVLPMTFADGSDYDKVQEGDVIDVLCESITPGEAIEIVLHHKDGSAESIKALHSCNEQQITWFRAGSALNSLNNK